MKQPARADNTPTNSNSFWNMIRSQLALTSDAGLARLIGLHPTVIHRSRHEVDPFKGLVSAEKQQHLLLELAKTFGQFDQMKAWLVKLGWPLTSEQDSELSQSFKRRNKYRFLRQLTDAYEPRADLEAQVIDCLRLREVPPEDALYAWAGVVLTGVRGQGKTALALGVLRDHPALEEEFPNGVYFLECYGLTAKQCLELLAVEAGIDLTTATSEQYLKVLRSRLKDKALLVVLDDVEDVTILRQFYDLLGTGVSSRLLVTTCQHLTERELAALRLQQIEVPDLTVQEGQRVAARLLRRLLTAGEQADFGRLHERVAGHPLALTILIGLQSESHSTWAELWRTLEDAPFTALEYPDATDKESSVRLCFDLVYDRLLNKHPPAARVFRALGVFAGVRGPIGLVCEAAELTEQVEITLQQLVRYRLLTIEPEGVGKERIWRTHPLLRDFAALKLQAQLAEQHAASSRFVSALLATLQTLRVMYEQQPATYTQISLVRAEVLQAIRLAAQLHDHTVLPDLITLGASLLIQIGAAESVAALLAELKIETTVSTEFLSAFIAAIKGQIELTRQRPRQARAYFEQALRVELPLSMKLAVLLAAARTELRLDQVAQTDDLVTQANTWAALNRPHTPLHDWAQIAELRAELALAANDPHQALGYFVQAEEYYEVAGWALSRARMQVERAACLILLNQSTEALPLLDRARGFFNAQTWPLIYLESLTENYCYAFIRQQDYETAQAELDRWAGVLEDFGPINVIPSHAKLWQWRGALAEIQQNYALAGTHYQHALAVWQQVESSESTQARVRERMLHVQTRLANGPATVAADGG